MAGATGNTEHNRYGHNRRGGRSSAGGRRLQSDDHQKRDDVAGWLAELRVEHRDLDEVIGYLEQTSHPDRMKVRRMKKRKLKLKDTIARLESRLIPDLDA